MTPNPTTIGASAAWTFSVANRSGVQVANVALRADLVSDVPLTFDTPSRSGCSLQPAGNQTTLNCQFAPLIPNAAESVRIASTGSRAGEVRGTVSVSILDRTPVDGATENNVASAALTISESISGGPVQILSAADARASAAGDLDGDGMTDLAVATGGNVLLYRGVADPANPSKRMLATAPVTLGASAGANAIAAADLDGDRDIDVVTANAATDVILVNGGASKFTASPLDNSADASRAVAVGDLDGDAVPEIVFANAQNGTLSRNSGAGKFTLAASFGNNDGRDVAIANLLGDASPELVFANGNADATIYRRSVTGFELAGKVATGPATSVAAADFDGDGDLDLVFGRAGSSPVYRNDSGSTPAFVLTDDLAATSTVDVLLADFDGDADVDVVTINGGGGHQVHLNDGGSTATFTAHTERFVHSGARSAALGKISVDARDDVIVVGSGGVGVFFNDGRANFGAGDTAAPTLTLKGLPTVELTVGAPYEELGATATDAADGDITGRVVISNPVNATVVGGYTVTYSVADSSGNAATPVTRSVQVRAQTGTGGGGGGSVSLELLLLALAAAVCFVRARRRTGRIAR